MNTNSPEFRNMAEMELARLTVQSVCINQRFAKLICPEARIRSRYGFFYMSTVQNENEKVISMLLRKMKTTNGFQAFIFIFSYPYGDRQPYRELFSLAGGGVTVIDATGVRMEQEANERYASGMAAFSMADSAHDPDAEEYRDRAYEELGTWTEKVVASPVTVYDGDHPEGVPYETLQSFYDRILREIRDRYPCSPDTLDLDDYFFTTLGARYHIRDGFYGQAAPTWKAGNPEKAPDRLFAYAWGDDSAWDDPRYAKEKIVILKKTFDAYIGKRLEKGERVSFREIFEYLRRPPYGMLPNIIGAILTGMFFRTWRDRGLIWSNGMQQDVLDDGHLLAMMENGIHNQHTYYRNSLEDTIMAPDNRLAALKKAAAEIFGLEEETARFLSGLRSGMRSSMEALAFPVVSARYAEIPGGDRKVIDGLIRFARLTSDEADHADADELAGSLNAAFLADDGLGTRIRDCLYGDSLRQGFEAMLEKNGLNPARATDGTPGRMCGGHPEWKWIWEETTILRRISVLEPALQNEPCRAVPPD